MSTLFFQAGSFFLGWSHDWVVQPPWTQPSYQVCVNSRKATFDTTPMTSIAASDGPHSLSRESSHSDLYSNAFFDGREVEMVGHSSNRAASIKSQGSLDDIELPEDIIKAEGLRHSDIVLNAK